MKIGITELIVIFVVALLVIGPDKLPAYAQKLGQAMAQFRKYSAEVTKEIKTSVVEPLEEAQKPLRGGPTPGRAGPRGPVRCKGPANLLCGYRQKETGTPAGCPNGDSRIPATKRKE